MTRVAAIDLGMLEYVRQKLRNKAAEFYEGPATARAQDAAYARALLHFSQNSAELGLADDLEHDTAGDSSLRQILGTAILILLMPQSAEGVAITNQREAVEFYGRGIRENLDALTRHICFC